MIKEIIPIENGKLGLEVSSRILHEKLGVKTSYRVWIHRRLKEYGFIEGRDFFSLQICNEINNVVKQGRREK
jgi:phage anti-repressor protein